MRRLGILGGLVLALTVVLPVSAGGNPGAVSVTQTWQGLTEYVDDVNPCTGNPVSITSTSNGVLHVTSFANGEYHFTLTDTQSFTFTEAGVTYTGQATFSAHENLNERNYNFTSTFAGQGRGSDGSHISVSWKAHLTFNAVGVVTVSFDVVSASCR